jgi:aquaporin Z
LVATIFLREAVAHPAINYVTTRPGETGLLAAFVAECGISFILITVVLRVSNTTQMARYTPLFAGVLLATYITVEAPLSGMSMNPARTFSSALAAQLWASLWIYFTAPPLGMLVAAEVYCWQKGTHAVRCAKLHHHNDKRCIFRCDYRVAQTQSPPYPGITA